MNEKARVEEGGASGTASQTEGTNGNKSEAAPQPDLLAEDLEKLQKENEKLGEDLKELKDKYIRSLAETENVRNRMKKQVEDAKVFGIQGFCKDLLEVADILKQATDMTPKDQLQDNVPLKTLYEGLTLTNGQLMKVFNKHGLDVIDPKVGDKFDPFFHEALFEVPKQGDCEGGTIAIIQKTGYQLHQRTLRPALVGVFKAS